MTARQSVQQSPCRNNVIAVAISITLHLLALWLVVRHHVDAPMARRIDGDGDTVTTLLMIPESQPRSFETARQPVVSVPRRPTVKSNPRPRATAPRAAPRSLQPRSVPSPTPPPPTPLIAIDKSLPAPKSPDTSDNLPADDFSVRLAAGQRQRAAEENQERVQQAARGTPEQQANERGRQIALANITSQMRAAGLEKDDAGGLFQLKHVGPHHAEFLFRGWKKEARRNWSQQLDVEQGYESDIRIAIVKKMIDIIRQHTQAEFTWDSHRLGRPIQLSARAEDGAGLEQFLLREFFPDFSTPAR